ncbi:MAG TPA: nuclear transport factor 2 family protein [Baekduia sp.]|nr:nuclear transport factor 2 family protein [Baekduia sp.]
MSTATPSQPTSADAEAVARRYFAAITARDLETAIACWQPGGREVVRGIIDAPAPEGVREFIGGMLAAIPDLRFEVVDTTTEGERCAVQWRLTGTFAGEPFLGFVATGARVELEGCDVLTVRDGLIVRNDAYTDGMTFGRQAGLLPPQGSKQDVGMQRAVNARTRMAGRLHAGPLEEIADGVWLLRGGLPSRTMNVYFVRDGEGVLVFDAGIKAMTSAVAAAGARLGGITRVVLGHAHADHRGVAPFLGVPVYCHPADKADAEGDGGFHYMDMSKLNPLGRVLMPRLLLKVWDGGPVQIAGTVEEGDRLGEFEVKHFPGHAPGLIGLWRERDRLAIVSDVFYTLDPQTGKKGHARVPHAAFNWDTEQARASIRKLAALEPAVAWAGHADPLTGDVRGILEHAADTT